jgi:hypothetical protein
MAENIGPGVGFVRHAGLTTMPDGTEIKGVIVELPAGPPEDMTFDVIFKQVPVRVIREDEYRRLCALKACMVEGG